MSRGTLPLAGHIKDAWPDSAGKEVALAIGDECSPRMGRRIAEKGRVPRRISAAAFLRFLLKIDDALAWHEARIRERRRLLRGEIARARTAAGCRADCVALASCACPAAVPLCEEAA
jgi:hypothetical protein